MKPRKNHIPSRSTPTLTQSGLLAVLLKHQHDKAIELAQRHTHRGQMRSAFSSALSWLLGHARAANSARQFRRVSHKSGAVFHQIHTYTELRQQIHKDLRLQHPDWVQPNGESPICDAYEARLMKLIAPLTGANVERLQKSPVV